MTNKQIKVLELLKEFIEIADKHNLEYFVFYGTLLGAKRHKGFIPWDDDIDLIIPKKTYDFLLENYSHKIKHNYNSNNFLLVSKFSNDNDTNIDAVFLDLFVVVKTNKKNIKKFLSLNTKIRYLRTFTYRRTFKCQWGIKFLKCFLWWTLLWKKILFNDAWEQLYDENGNLEMIIFWPSKKDVYCNVYNEIDFSDYEFEKFEDIKVKIPKNWENALVKNYGVNWQIPIKFKLSEHLGMYDMNVFTTKRKK
ncbi:diacylglycerol cholinephosphotransferase Mf1 [Mycoplasma elephantis]|uniref:diacylglycerol cholinephosphotransferase Mf1 n=1 Tax=Mycoplasma elephantis TaxID=114882 RepID=UPI00048626E2|nr:LicD family protein [Mycoplasma elephantis]